MGTWPALWLASGFGQNGALVWPPEIDIFEGALNAMDERDNMIRIGGQIRGAQTLSGKPEFTYNDPAYSRDTTNFSRSSSLRDTWFVIAADWTQDSICYLVDGVKEMCENYRWVDDQGVPANTASLLLNLAIGGDWAGAGGIDDAAFPTTFDIDYVRVYRN
jgi:beta-glucanase (GH16 family)